MNFVPLSLRRSARYIGHIDDFTIARARGWAIDLRAPDRPVSIAVLVRGRVVAVGPATQFRPDVADHGHPSANCGFDIALDLLPKDISSGNVSVVFWQEGRPIHELSPRDRASDALRRPFRSETSWMERLRPSRDAHASMSPAAAQSFLDCETPSATEPKRSILVEGVFAGDYSLAIVNRCFARALLDMGHDVRLHSSEAGLAQDQLFNADARVKDVFVADPDFAGVEIHTLNTWPPETGHMRAGFRVLHCYAWEESEFPPQFVEQFNRDLDLICVTSRYSKEALENSGVVVPIEVIGNGMDHMLARAPKRPKAARTKPFQFLHVSSCFPRKGADVLVRSFLEEFRDETDVRLVIKTFDNPHNEIERLLIDLGGGAIPRSIELVKANLSPAELYQLYISSDCLVAPSRGEGFLLPAAEAMALDLPVVVTDAGGQSDFCDETTCWPIRSHAAAAATHMNLRNSFWFEPDPGSLKKQMRAVYLASPEEIHARTSAARRRVSDLYRWDKVARRFLRAVTKHVGKSREARGPRRTAIVSTWSQDCGIATYTGNLIASLPEGFDVTVVAEDVGRITEDEAFVTRVWTRSRSGVRRLCDYLLRSNFEAVLIQHHPGILSWSDLAFIVDALRADRARNIKVFVQLHSTVGARAALTEVAASLSRLSGLFVHTLDDVLELPKLAQSTRVAVVPHGISNFTAAVSEEEKATPDPADDTIGSDFHIGSFGFCMPHKGILENILALHFLRKRVPNVKATLLHSITDERKTIDYALRAMALVKSLALENVVELDFRMLPLDEVRRRLSKCDLLVFSYRPNAESASGALREVAGLQIPLLCTPVSTFGDLGGICFSTGGFEPVDIADAMCRFYSNAEMARSKRRAQAEYVEAHSWARIRMRLFNIVEIELRERDMQRERL